MVSAFGCAPARVGRSCPAAAARAATSCPPDGVLPSDRRIRNGDEFGAVVRGGRRASRRTLVVHLLREAGPVPARAGFVVSRAVGGSVVRHRVVRRLRALVAPRLSALPQGSLVVVRALPPAAEATSAQLGSDLDAALARLLPAEAA
jgi:ribonuclease P protein component